MKVLEYSYVDTTDNVYFKVSEKEPKNLYGDIEKYDIVFFRSIAGELIGIEIFDFIEKYESGVLKEQIEEVEPELLWEDIVKVYERIKRGDWSYGLRRLE